MFLMKRNTARYNIFIVKQLYWMSTFICIFSFTSFGNNLLETSFPVVFKADLKTPISTSLYIKCDVTDYNLGLEGFKVKKKEKKEVVMEEIIDAFRYNDFEKIKKNSGKKSNASKEDNERLIKSLFDGYRSTFFNEVYAGKEFKHLRIKSQLHFGNRRILIFGNDSEPNSMSAPSRFPLYFKDDKKEGFAWDLDQVPVAVSVLTDSVHQMAISPKKFIKKKNLKLKYEMPITSTTEEHITFLQFNGSKYNFKVLSDTLDSSDKLSKVLALVQKKYSAAHEDKRAIIADLYTEPNRQKYLDWLENADPSYLDSYFEDMGSKERIVRFIIDADPLYVVFVGRADRPNTLNSELVLRDPEDGNLKFTNVYFRGFITQLFSSREFLSRFSDYIITESGQSIER